MELRARSSAVEQWTHNPLVVGSNPTGPICLLFFVGRRDCVSIWPQPFFSKAFVFIWNHCVAGFIRFRKIHSNFAIQRDSGTCFAERHPVDYGLTAVPSLLRTGLQ